MAVDERPGGLSRLESGRWGRIREAEAGPPQENLFVLAAPVSERVEIHTVLVAECSAFRTPDADTEVPGLAPMTRIEEVGISVDREAGMIVLSPKFSLRMASAEAPEEESRLKIHCTFVIQYRCKNFEGIEASNIAAFAQTNGVFNAWPYWREFAQNMTSRLGLKPVLVPLFRF